ncbi:hypothetical protein U1Q18_033448, partial [Sarracenia purpurea var. burkii]
PLIQTDGRIKSKAPNIDLNLLKRREEELPKSSLCGQGSAADPLTSFSLTIRSRKFTDPHNRGPDSRLQGLFKWDDLVPTPKLSIPDRPKLRSSPFGARIRNKRGRKGLSPILSDASTPDFSAAVPNLALKSTILNWCNSSLVDHPKPIDNDIAEDVICAQVASKEQQFQETKNKTQGAEEDDNNGVNLADAQAELNRRSNLFGSNSEESMAAATSGSSTPLPLTTRPSCCSCLSSSEIDVLNPSPVEEDDVVAMLKSPRVFGREEAVKSLRKITRTREEWKCDPRS